MAVLASVTACGVFGDDDGPPRHRVVLPEPAPPSAQWIIDTVKQFLRSKECPAPTLSTLIVLDDNGRDRAMALWLLDDVDYCAVHLGDPWNSLQGGAIDDLAKTSRLYANGVVGPEQYIFTAFPGRQDSVSVTEDTDHVAAPPASRPVDLGGGRWVTFAEFRLLSPTHGEDPSVNLCPTSGDCHFVDARATQFPTFPAPDSSPKNTP